MSAIELSGLIFLLMLVMMAIRIPIAACMFFAGAFGYVTQAGPIAFLNYLKGAAFARFSVYDLSVIPLFLLMGQFASQGGLSRSLFQFARVMLGGFRGGMAMAAVWACAAFGAVCGSSIATAATIGTVALPEMRRNGYSGRLATATLAASGTLGIMIPPSVPLVIYAILTEQNIAKLFAAAFIPGLIAAVGYTIAIAVYVRVVPGHAPDVETVAKEPFLDRLAQVAPILIIFLIVFGGIYAGLFTPTEAAAIGVAATFLAATAKKELTLEKIKSALLATGETCAFIFLIILGADVLNSALALTNTPQELAKLIGGMSLSPYMIIVVILGFHIILGSVMDELAMIMLTIPIFFPIVMGLDLGMATEDKAIWFGILMLMVVEIGLVHPPLGLNVYVVNSMARDVPISESFLGTIPFLITDFLRTALIFFFPAISLALLKWLY